MFGNYLQFSTIHYWYSSKRANLNLYLNLLYWMEIIQPTTKAATQGFRRMEYITKNVVDCLETKWENTSQSWDVYFDISEVAYIKRDRLKHISSFERTWRPSLRRHHYHQPSSSTIIISNHRHQPSPQRSHVPLHIFYTSQHTLQFFFQ